MSPQYYSRLVGESRGRGDTVNHPPTSPAVAASENTRAATVRPLEGGADTGGAGLQGGWSSGGYPAVSPCHLVQPLSAVATPTLSVIGPLPSPAPDLATFQSPYTRQHARRWQPTALEPARGPAAWPFAEQEVRVPPGLGLPPRSEQYIQRSATVRASWKRALPSRRQFRHAEEYKLGCSGSCFPSPVRHEGLIVLSHFMGRLLHESRATQRKALLRRAVSTPRMVVAHSRQETTRRGPTLRTCEMAQRNGTTLAGPHAQSGLHGPVSPVSCFFATGDADVLRRCAATCMVSRSQKVRLRFRCGSQ